MSPLRWVFNAPSNPATREGCIVSPVAESFKHSKDWHFPTANNATSDCSPLIVMGLAYDRVTGKIWSANKENNTKEET